MSGCVGSGTNAGAEQPSRPSAMERAGFEQVDELDGIIVYSHGRSQLLHFVAEARFDAPPRAVQLALLDYERHPEHIHRLASSRVLRRGPGSLVVYQRLDMPVIDDRDYTLAVTWGQRGGILWLSFQALPFGPPRVDGVVRVRSHSGGWRLEPVEGGTATRARYETRMDLGGWIPLWMARGSAGKEVAQVLQQFRQMVAARRATERSTNAERSGSASPPTVAGPRPAGSR
ncbi:MAG: hypothetical protein JRI23_18915 [Deltaproteobacteria bacterium]|jgi:hypothetical protein|nr:hypothetical protein [Deltaproteobacteria bacterium]MBW2533936.1 hypothetical protein [Deltaproteobacteria bacterium]